jgi:hypothetical protein
MVPPELSAHFFGSQEFTSLGFAAIHLSAAAVADMPSAVMYLATTSY